MKIDLQKIEEYLLGELPTEEVVSFEQELENNPQLQRKVDIQKAIHEGIRQKKREDLKKELNNIHENFMNGEEKTTSSAPKEAKIGRLTFSRKIIGIAASLLVLITAAIYVFYPSNKLSPEELFAQNYTRYEISLQKGGSDEVVLKDAKELYLDKNYAAAATKIDAYLQNNPTNVEAQFIKGITQLETGAFDASIHTFSEIKNPLFKELSLWYQAMAFLKNKDTVRCKALLEQGISNKIFSPPLKEKATALIREL